MWLQPIAIWLIIAAGLGLSLTVLLWLNDKIDCDWLGGVGLVMASTFGLALFAYTIAFVDFGVWPPTFGPVSDTSTACRAEAIEPVLGEWGWF